MRSSQFDSQKGNLDNQFKDKKEDFLKFFDQFYKNNTKNFQSCSVKELAQKLADKYFTSQLKPRYSTENHGRTQKPSHKPIRFLQPSEAIMKAKQKFKAKQEKLLLLQKKLPPVSIQRQKSRSISVQQPIITAKCNSAAQQSQQSGFYTYAIGEGNNHQLIKQLLESRQIWVMNKDPNAKIVNFRWQETEKGYEFRTLVSNAKETHQLFNHFEFHLEITNKYYLALNLKTYCDKHQLNIYDFIPTTFSIESNTQSLRQALLPFSSFYRANAPAQKQQEIDKQLSKNYLKIQQLVDQKYESQYPTLFGDSYLWIFKPSNMNQGRGIHIIQTIQDALEVIQKYQNGYKEHLLEVKRNDQNEIINKIVYINTLSTDHFVIQKYIEQPLLIEDRKFDVRVYLMLTTNLNCYFFKEGQLRLATEKFNLQKIDNYIHLTNNAVQYNHPQYGKSEDGNQYSFQQASKYFKIDFRAKVIDKIKTLSQMVLCSVKHRINKYKRKYCFEIFGFDYILDDQFKPWLIEVNTNPSLEVTSKLLNQLFPRLIDDAFKLTLDQLFPIAAGRDNKFPLMDYSDDENLWEFLGPLSN